MSERDVDGGAEAIVAGVVLGDGSSGVEAERVGVLLVERVAFMRRWAVWELELKKSGCRFVAVDWATRGADQVGLGSLDRRSRAGEGVGGTSSWEGKVIARRVFGGDVNVGFHRTVMCLIPVEKVSGS